MKNWIKRKLGTMVDSEREQPFFRRSSSENEAIVTVKEFLPCLIVFDSSDIHRQDEYFIPPILDGSR